MQISCYNLIVIPIIYAGISIKCRPQKCKRQTTFMLYGAEFDFFFTGGQAHVGLELLNMVLFISRYIIKYYSKISPVLRGNS